MRDGLQLKRMIWAWMATMWTASAAAAQATFVTDLATIPIAAVAVAAVISLIGGAAATLAKIASPDVAIKNLTVVVLADVMSSLVAGEGIFFLCAWREFDPLLAAACIFVAGFGGSRVIDRLLGVGMSQIDRLGGKPQGTP